MNNELFIQYAKGGQEENVWEKIIQLGELALSEQYWSDVSQVMDECMERVLKNFVILKQELEGNGYIFENIGGLNLNYYIIKPNKEQINFSSLQNLMEEETGFIPFSLLFFYKKIDGVDFRGNFMDWDNPYFLDAIVIYSIDEFSKINDGATSFRVNGKLKYRVLFSPDEFSKEDFSGDIGYGLELSGTQRIDNNVIGFGKTLSFIEYLRLCFKWAGLVGLELYEGEEIPDYIMKIIVEIRKKMLAF